MTDYGEDWQYEHYLKEILSTLRLPCPATVLNEPVILTKLTYSGNFRRGIIATVKKPKGGAATIAACELTLDPSLPRCHAFDRYRRWMGLTVKEPKAAKSSPSEDLPVGAQVTFVALSIHRDHTFCRLLDSMEPFPFRGKDNWQLHPAELIYATLIKPWRPTGGRAMWARMEKREFNIPALNLTPLKLLDPDPWSEPSPTAIHVAPCMSYEMEEVLPGWSPNDKSPSPIERAIALQDDYEFEGARHLLTDLFLQDLRCLDAFAHLGAFEFKSFSPHNEYFEAGFRIGELSLGKNFKGVLPWERLGNRPFLRCMHGYGLTLWRQERFSEAHDIFLRLLKLNPSDNQGIRFLLDDVKAQRPSP